MYAIIETGGKQYKVCEGDTLCVEKLPVKAGEKFAFDQVLMIGGNGTAKIGQPTVDGAKVTAHIVAHDRDAKVVVFKKKRRKGYQKRYGHRQPYTEVKIDKISG